MEIYIELTFREYNSSTNHFGESLRTTSSRQKTQHYFRSAKNSFLALCCNSVLTGNGKLKSKRSQLNNTLSSIMLVKYFQYRQTYSQLLK